MWEIWVQSLGLEDPQEKGKATHSSILSWRIPSPWGCRVRHNWATFIFLFLGSKITADSDGWWLQPGNQKTIASWQESYDKPRQCAEKQRHYSTDKGPYSQGYGLSSGHVWLWQLDYKEGWMPKNWCLQTVVLEKTLESALDTGDQISQS